MHIQLCTYLSELIKKRQTEAVYEQGGQGLGKRRRCSVYLLYKCNSTNTDAEAEMSAVHLRRLLVRASGADVALADI